MSATAEGERPLQDKSSRPRLNQHDGLINSTAQITQSLQRWHSSVLSRHIINQGEIGWERKALRRSHVPRWYSLQPQRPQISAGVEHVLQAPPRAKARVQLPLVEAAASPGALQQRCYNQFALSKISPRNPHGIRRPLWKAVLRASNLIRGKGDLGSFSSPSRGSFSLSANVT